MKIFIPLFLLLSLFSSTVTATTDMYAFHTTTEQQQFKHLISQLRCLVCQNQDLADSNAGLAKDLRQEVYQMVSKGLSNEQIITYLTDRYGQFILFKPRVEPVTYILWFAPLLLLAIGFLVLVRKIRK